MAEYAGYTFKDDDPTTPLSAGTLNPLTSAAADHGARIAALENAEAPEAPAPAWDDITGKPDTFAPTIGTTATTAKAGNWKPTWSEVSNKPTIPSTDGLATVEALNAAIARIEELEAQVRALTDGGAA